ncbi:endonuclease/exonuclease/phosphatase family domain-containing protein 1 isoform X2 [Hoplias malabaricus]|uniref:endonuclease/exonuclease/phosphatase family domain-containing protein 1 isoform X2 n=1 Tax=Hoplias malabaricus TaxID=27720 RepID=UPI0034621D96
MGGSLGCHRSIPRDHCELGRKLSAACNFSDVLVKQQLQQLQLQDKELQQPDCTQPPPRHDHQCLDINTCTEEELMTLPGVSRALARNVVQHRARIGGFRRVEDLALVSGVGAARLQLVRPEICVGGKTGGSPSSSSSSSSSLSSPAQCNGLQSSGVSHTPHSQEESSESQPPESLPPGGPGQMTSSRPGGVQECDSRGKPLFRVATWDLQRCSSDKANNPGVREVVCMTLLENHIKLLAVQDLADREALNKGPEYSGFLWDSSAGVELKDASVLATVNGNGNHSQPKPFLGHFYIGSSELNLMNVHLKAPSLSKENRQKHGSDRTKHPRLSSTVQDTLRGMKDVLVLGGFGLPSDGAELESLKKEKLSALLPPSVFTNISTKTPQGTCALDNIWASRSMKKIYAGHCCVVREGLTNPWIPDNWSWGGVASEHCPVFAEFYLDTTVTMMMKKKEQLQNGSSSVAALERDNIIVSKHER